MKTPAIKVCGMRYANNIRAVAQLPIDFMGFIFYPSSPRYVGNHFVLPTHLPKSIKRVGIFVNENTDIMVSKVNQYELDFVQLHGDESVAQCAELDRQGIRIIKAFSVNDIFHFATTIPYEPFVRYFLFDTKGKNYGGNGVTFDWKVLQNYHQSTPFILSGGLNEWNITKISQLKNLNLFAIDLNSGVEDKPGIKNSKKIETIISKIKIDTEPHQ